MQTQETYVNIFFSYPQVFAQRRGASVGKVLLLTVFVCNFERSCYTVNQTLETEDGCTNTFICRSCLQYLLLCYF